VGEAEGEPCLVVYVKSPKPADTEFLKEGWKGFPVVIRKLGVPRLVTSAFRSNRR
jgi:hypothetical protein